MNTILIAVILISGYIYVNLSLSTRYRYKRSEGWDAYFFVAAWGAVFVCGAWLVCSLLSVTGVFRWLVNSILYCFDLKADVFQRLLPISFEKSSSYKELKVAAWGVVSIALAGLVGYQRKRKTEKGDRRFDALARAVGNNPFESMLMEASVRQFPVIVTLSSRKFYVGLVSCPAFEHGDCHHIELLPLLSGYRDKDTLTINITTNYRQHYIEAGICDRKIGGLSLSDFRTLVDKRVVESISFFDPSTYTIFKQHEEGDKQACKSLDTNFQPRK
ncbi:hypothetical protein TI10_22395 [Photorhabdus luminescens subsp. luminescens]|uniref:Heat-inducible transcription repressor HrcA n=1 Tax=Photorhabdus luminescens TaxID=29488 RepID=A0A1G5QH46_PHOLU|nr:hypothetical protein [Photorhabdus luminescens]KMW71146.1 hypothetical protein TI10_22395 [Photorhabdus luminescens subsp. luminescens]SCZ61114.1 heat-inducible transcription repressor HrcA [Photorhabdus luminescens]